MEKTVEKEQLEGTMTQRLDGHGVVEKFKILFKDDPSLMEGLNDFLPKGRESTVTHKRCMRKKAGSQSLKDSVPNNLEKAVTWEEYMTDEAVRALNFVKKVKIQFQNDKSIYEKFEKILDMNAKGNKSIHDVYQEVKVLFSNNKDLLDEFTHFLPEYMQSSLTHHTSSPGSTFVLKSNNVSKQEGIFKSFQTDLIKDDERTDAVIEDCHRKKVEKERGHKNDREQKAGLHMNKSISVPSTDRELDFMDGHTGKRKRNEISDDLIISQRLIDPVDKDIAGHSQQDRKENRDHLKELKKENERNKEQDHGKDRDGKKNHQNRSKDTSKRNASQCSTKKKFIDKSIWELGLSKCERCTPSYRLLPDHYTKPICSYRTDVAAEVLNDKWVSRQARSSRENRNGHMNWSESEINFFARENERFELDMFRESTEDAIKHIEELLEKMHNNTFKSHGHIQIEGHITAMNLGCIERIFDGDELDIISQLHKNPDRFLPIILDRLHQKQDELSKQHRKLNKIWADGYAENNKENC